MKTKNKSVKRKISFDDSNEDHPSGVSKKPNVGHPTTNESAPRALETDKDKFCQTNDVSQQSLANTSCVSLPGNFPQEVANGAVPITQQSTFAAVTTTPPHTEEGAFHMPAVWQHQHRPTFATNPTTASNGFNHVPTRGTQHCIPLEYTHMGRCSCVCRHCGAMFWECEKLSRSGFGGVPIYNKCCNGGQVVLRPPPEYPEYLKALYANTHFMENIRAYNQMFSMASLGANIDNSINNGRGPYVFRISGQIYHWIGSMCPPEGNAPRFLQLYIYDTTNEVNNRMSHFVGEHDSGLKREIVEGLIELLDNHNALVQLFRTARNKLNEANVPEFKVKLYNVVGTRRYELPTPETIGAIVFGGTSITETEFDLIVEEHSRIPQRVNKLHPCYMSLQFPLLFIYGEEGYHKDMKLVNIPTHSGSAAKRMTMNMYYAYQIHDRLNHYNLLPRGGKLFQQYVVTAYCAVEQNRLDYI
ncbi:hypothetical protein Tco_0880477 [Tanacetum coccineum]